MHFFIYAVGGNIGRKGYVWKDRWKEKWSGNGALGFGAFLSRSLARFFNFVFFSLLGSFFLLFSFLHPQSVHNLMATYSRYWFSNIYQQRGPMTFFNIFTKAPATFMEIN